MIAQHSCTAIFATEVLLKLLAFGPWLYFTNGCGRARRVFFGDPRTRARARGPVKRTRARNSPSPPARPSWNVFDSLIVALSFSDKAFSVSGLLVFRIIRPFRKVIGGLSSRSTRSWVLLLLLLTYMFAVLGVPVPRRPVRRVLCQHRRRHVHTAASRAETWGARATRRRRLRDGVARPILGDYPHHGSTSCFTASPRRIAILGTRFIDTLLRTPAGMTCEGAGGQAGQARAITEGSSEMDALAPGRFKARETTSEQPAQPPPRATRRSLRGGHRRPADATAARPPQQPQNDDATRGSLPPRQARAAGGSSPPRQAQVSHHPAKLQPRAIPTRDTKEYRCSRCTTRSMPSSKRAWRFGGPSRVWVPQSRTCTRGETIWR